MQKIGFRRIIKALDNIRLADFHLVVGIAEGGVVPAHLVAYKLGCDLRVVRFNYRNRKNLPQHPQPILLSKLKLPQQARRILLVDDVAISGKTLAAAKKLLGRRQVKTLVLRGAADYVLFPRLNSCRLWPWKL